MGASTQPQTKVAMVGAATVRARLPHPLQLGDLTIAEREYCLVAVKADSGAVGYGFTLTRGGPVASIVRNTIAGLYAGGSVGEPAARFAMAMAQSRPTLMSGVGLRALSLVDLATHDLHARMLGLDIVEVLGGLRRPMPVRAVVGYPSGSGPDEVADEVRQLMDQGWRHFKLPIAPSRDLTIGRVRSAIDIAGPGRVSLDCAWTFQDVASVVALVGAIGPDLEFLEDINAPGQPDLLIALRAAMDVPVAMGDEQNGPDFPERLLERRCVDILRVDATCAGGASTFPDWVSMARTAGIAISPHMNGRVHAALLAGVGVGDWAVEWGPGSWVDPYESALGMPVVADGTMLVMNEGPGFGRLIDRAWLGDQVIEDPDGILRW